LQPAPETNSRLISKAGNPETCFNETAIEELVELYRPFVLAVIAGRSVDNDTVDDVSQDFIRKKMMSGLLFRAWTAKPTGRFRSYLRKSVHNFCNDVWNKEKKLPTPMALDCVTEPSEMPLLEMDEEAAWIRTIFAQSVSHMKFECQEKDQQEIWRLFYDHVLAPLFLDADNSENASAMPIDQRARNRLVSAGRKFRRIFREKLLTAGGFEQDLEATELGLLLRRTCADSELVSFLAGRQFFDDEVSRIFLSGSASPNEVHLAAVKYIDSRDQQRWLSLLNQKADIGAPDLQAEIAETPEAPLPTQTTIGDVLFANDCVSIELVHKLRTQARNLATDSTESETGVFYVLYTHLICLLLTKWDLRATRLNSVQLLHNIEQCKRLQWLDDDSHVLLGKAITILSEKD